jgi:hypothetical protein
MEYDTAVNLLTQNLSLTSANIVASAAVSHICPDNWYKVVIAQIAFPPEARIPI